MNKDVGLLADCERIVVEAKDGLGGLDIIISNAVSQKSRHITRMKKPKV